MGTKNALFAKFFLNQLAPICYEKATFLNEKRGHMVPYIKGNYISRKLVPLLLKSVDIYSTLNQNTFQNFWCNLYIYTLVNSKNKEKNRLTQN